MPHRYKLTFHHVAHKMSADVKNEVTAVVGRERLGSSPATVPSPSASDNLLEHSQLQQQRNLPPFSSFGGGIGSTTTDSMETSSPVLTSLQTHEMSLALGNWDYYEGLSGRLMDGRGEVVIASQYRPWESKHHSGIEGLPSFASQFATSSVDGESQTLTTLTPLSPASVASHSPPLAGLPSFHTLSGPLPVPQPQRAHSAANYPLVPAPVQAREVPMLQQQIIDERHIQLLGSVPGVPVQSFITSHAAPQVTSASPSGSAPHHMMLTSVKQSDYPQLHHANFQNPMSTVLDTTSSISRIDGRKKERRKIRASSLDTDVDNSAGSVESSGQVAAVSSTASRGGHHGTSGLTGDGEGSISDKPAKKKRKRCGECIGCQRKDNCGDCAPCRNDKSHQICKMRRCEKLTEKKVSTFCLSFE